MITRSKAYTSSIAKTSNQDENIRESDEEMDSSNAKMSDVDENSSERNEEVNDDENEQNSSNKKIHVPVNHCGDGRLRKETDNTLSGFWLWPGIILVLAVLLFFVTTYMSYSVNDSVSQDNFTCSDREFVLEHLNIIKDKFSSQPENTWFTFGSAIQKLFADDPIGPAVFLLFHEPDDRTVNCLVKDVSDFAAKCFNGNASAFSVAGTTLSNDTFVKDSGELLVRFENEIKDKKVMIVDGLNDVDPEVAKEFHYFCDTYQPFVKEAVYFFTLKRVASDISSNSTFIKVVNNELRSLWKTLSYDKLDALITRMTLNIIRVNNEGNINC